MNRSKKIFGSVFIALLIVCLILSVVGIGYYTDGFTNFVKDSAAPMETIPASVASDALIVEIDEAHNQQVIQSGEGIIIQNVKLASSPQNAEGDNSMRKTLVATVYPEDAADKSIDWTVSFVDPNSEWASNKNVADYITVEPEVDGGLTAIVYCHRAFGEQIKITATSRVNSSASATCFVDYSKKLSKESNVNYSFYSSTFKGKTAQVSCINGELVNDSAVCLIGGFYTASDFSRLKAQGNNEKRFVEQYSSYTVDTNYIYHTEFYVKPTDTFALLLENAGLRDPSSSKKNLVAWFSYREIANALCGKANTDDYFYPSSSVAMGDTSGYVSHINNLNSVCGSASSNQESYDFSLIVSLSLENSSGIIDSAEYEFRYKFDSNAFAVSNLILSDSALTF